jgi:hypothetical protein
VPPRPSDQSPFGPATPSPSASRSPFGPAPAEYPPGDYENPYQAPADYLGTYPAFGAARPGTITPTLIDMGETFSRTWTIFKDQWGMCLVVVVVCTIIKFIVAVIIQWGGIALGMVAGGGDLNIVLGQWGGYALSQLFTLWIDIGLILFFVKTARGQEASFGDVFAGGPYFLRVLGATVLLVCGGLLIVAICALPGLAIWLSVGGEEGIFMGFAVTGLIAVIPLIIYGLTFSQFRYLIVDHNAGAVESIGLSREITRGNRLTIIATVLIAGIASMFVAIFTCGLGYLAVLPYLTLLFPVMYLGMIGQPVAPAYQTR